MLNNFRKLFVGMILSNRVTRALMRRIALDERSLADLLRTERIRVRIRQNEELKLLVAGLAREIGVVARNSLSNVMVSAHSPAITRISPGLNWGPHPFPLTRHAMLWRKSAAFSAECWVKGLAADASIELLCPVADEESAKSFAGRHRQIKQLTPVSESSNFDKTLDAIVVPLGKGEGLGSTGSLYPAIEALWRVGFRQFVFTGISGACQIELFNMPSELKGKHSGKACVVIGKSSGSVINVNESLKAEVCLVGSEQNSQLEYRGFASRYLVHSDSIMDDLHLLQKLSDIPDDVVKLVPWDALALFQSPNVCPVSLCESYLNDISGDSEVDFSSGSSLQDYFLLQWALHLACNPIYLLNVDAEGNRTAFERLRKYAESRQIKIIEIGEQEVLTVFDRQKLESSS